MKTVFVYGSLKKGFGNHRFLSDQEMLGKGYVEGFEMYSLGRFPGIKEGQGRVVGELYRVDEDTFRALDRLEGHPVMYQRQLNLVTTDEGDKVEAWVYVYQGNPSDDELVGEEWKHEHLSKRS